MGEVWKLGQIPRPQEAANTSLASGVTWRRGAHGLSERNGVPLNMETWDDVRLPEAGLTSITSGQARLLPPTAIDLDTERRMRNDG